MAITAQQVKELREKTGAGMMECKKALTEAEGKVDLAIKILRERGLAAAATKAGRATREGIVGQYIHAGGKLGVLVEVNCETDFVARTPEFQEFVKDIAMQVAAMNPVAVDKDDVDEKIIEKEIEIGKEQARQEGKPEEMLEKIALGKLNKFYKENTLLNQDFVRDTKKTVKQYMSEKDKDLTVVGFKRLMLGE